MGDDPGTAAAQWEIMPLTDKGYTFRNVASGRYLNVAPNHHENHPPAQVEGVSFSTLPSPQNDTIDFWDNARVWGNSSNASSPRSQWVIDLVQDDIYTLKGLDSNMYLNVLGGWDHNGANVHMWDNWYSNHSQWQIQSALPPTHVSLELLSGNVNCGQLPELDKFSVKQKFLVPNVNIPLTAENKPEIYGYQTGSNWVGRFEATLDVSVGGSYTFALDMGPADTAFLWLDGEQVITTGCSWGKQASGSTTLTAGKHPIVVLYLDDGWKDKVVLSYKGPDTAGAMLVVPPHRFLPSGM